MRIIKPKPSDIRSCVRIHTLCDYGNTKNIKEAEKLTFNYIRKGMANNDCIYLMAKSDFEAIGFASFIYDKWNNSILIDQLFVRPDMQGRGIGSKLLRRALEKAKKMGVRIAFLHTGKSNNNAITFYKKNGFSVAGQIKVLYGHDTESDAIVLSYKLR